MAPRFAKDKERWSTLGVTLGILVVCACIFSVHYRLPGLFMDSINPEYLAAKILSGGEGFKAWILPGNLIFGKYPVLAGSYYHGPLQLYLSLPVYMIMGLNIASARTAQCLYALAILLVASRLLRRAGVGHVLLLVGLLLLTLDPAFVQVFKTQGLSNLWPLSLYLLSLLMVDRAGEGASRWWLVGGGILLGLAFFAYFIYLFFAPVVYVQALLGLSRSGGKRGRAFSTSLLLVLGFVVGALPYCVGFYLLYAELGSISAFLANLHGGAESLQIIRAPAHGVVAVLGEMWRDISSALTDLWLNAAVFSKPGLVAQSRLQAAVFLCVPFLFGGYLAARRASAKWLHLINASIAMYLVASLPFAARFEGHHYVMLLPLGYLAWILAFHYLLLGATVGVRRYLIGVGVVLALIVAAGNIRAHASFLNGLARTGGAGTYTDALNHLAEDVARGDPDRLYYLPDWGFMMPLQFLTAGKVVVEPSEPDPATVRRLLCDGQTVSVIYDLLDPHDINAEATHQQRLRELRAAVPGMAVQERVYNGKDGTPEFTVVALSGSGASTAVCGVETLPACTITSQAGVSIVPEPCDIRRCPKPAGRRPEVSLSWDASARASAVEVWVGDANGKKLWLSSSAKGKQSTGAWAYSGMEFELRDAATGDTLAKATLGGRDCAL